MMPESPWELPSETHVAMGRVLQIGLFISMVLLMVSLGAFLLHHPTEPPSHLITSNPLAKYLSPQGLLAGLIGLHPEAYMTLAVIVLAVTPAVRVFTGFYYFVRMGDRPLAEITLTVFLLLLLGFLVIGPILR
jgi:uncharacterized membrane protein